MIYITNVDLVNVYGIQNLVLNCLFLFKILSKNSILTLIKGHNSIANLPKFELIQALMHVLVTCKNEEDQIEIEGARLLTSQDFSHYKYMGTFQDAQGQLTLQSTVRSDQILNSSKISLFDLLTCKDEEDPIQNKGPRVFTTLYINFSDVQGQITLVLVVVSGRNLNSSKLSCMPSLPARRRLIKSKMKELESLQDFSHYKSMGIFPDAQGQLTPQSKFELIQAFMHVLLTCKNEDDRFKHEGARVFTRFLPL